MGPEHVADRRLSQKTSFSKWIQKDIGVLMRTFRIIIHSNANMNGHIKNAYRGHWTGEVWRLAARSSNQGE